MFVGMQTIPASIHQRARASDPLCVCVCVRERVRVCVCVCLSVESGFGDASDVDMTRSCVWLCVGMRDVVHSFCTKVRLHLCIHKLLTITLIIMNTLSIRVHKIVSY